jgi:hypothetical protein
VIRFFLIGAVVCSVLFFGAALVGRAIDTEIQDRVIFTRNGVTLDCERLVRGGEVEYDNCHNVP